MSEDTTDLPDPDADPDAEEGVRPAVDATVLRFPSNRPLGRPATGPGSPRLRDVVGDVLREERHRQERTLADVAGEAAVSVPYLSEVERGRKEVSSDVLDAIGVALDLPLAEILWRSADRLRVEGSGGLRPQGSTRFRLAA